ncbi:MAG: hypothetical protein ACE5DO_06485 [Desulfobacterales bacterium]
MTKEHNCFQSDFSFKMLPVIEKRVFRMGIAGNYGIDSSDVEWAAEQGANYWVWGASFKKVTEGIKEIIRKNREKNVVALLGWGEHQFIVRVSSIRY